MPSDFPRARAPDQPAAPTRAPAATATEFLIKLPARARPEKCFAAIDRYLALLSGRHVCKILVSCDVDDETMNNAAVRERFRQYPTVEVRFGHSRSKVEANNADMDAAGDFEVLFMASDDMLPEVPGYDAIIVERMRRYFPSNDGVLFFNDGHQGRQVNTQSILGRRYYQRFGYLFHPDYLSLWCDNEFTEVAYRLGRQIYFDEILIRHQHPGVIGAPVDALLQRNNSFDQRDKAVFEARAKRGFEITPRHLLSVVLVAGARGPAGTARLEQKLRAQIAQARTTHTMEILHLTGAEPGSWEAPWRELLAQARGEYVCCVQADDDLAPNYVAEVYAAIADGSRDYAGIAGLISFRGGPQKFVSSTAFSDRTQRDGTFRTPPSLLNPIRRALLVQALEGPAPAAGCGAWQLPPTVRKAIVSGLEITAPIYWCSPAHWARMNSSSAPVAVAGATPGPTGNEAGATGSAGVTQTMLPLAAGAMTDLMFPGSRRQRIVMGLSRRLGGWLAGRPQRVDQRPKRRRDQLDVVINGLPSLLLRLIAGWPIQPGADPAANRAGLREYLLAQTRSATVKPVVFEGNEGATLQVEWQGFFRRSEAYIDLRENLDDPAGVEHLISHLSRLEPAKRHVFLVVYGKLAMPCLGELQRYFAGCTYPSEGGFLDRHGLAIMVKQVGGGLSDVR
ncbi:MAG: hypothetical protein ACREJ2_14495 [Planctomycetota bacterium]